MSTFTAEATSLPLSAAQLGVWFAHQLDAKAATYNLSNYIEIHGPVDAEAFKQAIRQAELECGTFDVRLREEPDGPRQVPVDRASPGLQVIDLSGRPDPLAEARGWMAQDQSAPVDVLHGFLSVDACSNSGRTTSSGTTAATTSWSTGTAAPSSPTASRRSTPDW